MRREDSLDLNVEKGIVRRAGTLYAYMEADLKVFAGHNGTAPGDTLRITFGDYRDDFSIHLSLAQARQIVAGLTSALD